MSIRLASWMNPKAKMWVKGRINVLEKLQKEVHAKLNPGEQIFWFHCASLGEFEQGRPLLEKIRQPGIRILLTFFSPSGYEVQKNYTGADFIFYLPADTRSNAKHFVEGLPLKAVFFVKYEFWFNYLYELKNKNVPVFLVSGIFRQEQYFFKRYGLWARNQLKCFTHFFLQNENSRILLNQFGFNNTTISGDTRFDRVFEIAENKKDFPLVHLFVGNSPVIVAGSTWEEDEKIISDLSLNVLNLKLILAPHEVKEKHILSILNLFEQQKIIRYSQATVENVKGATVLLIDTIGMLSSLYQYGQVAYIGGGFGEGIHNILEAATFGLPVVFGPNYSKFNEAIELIELGGAFTITTKVELEQIIHKLFNDVEYLQEVKTKSKDYVWKKKGASDIILNNIEF